MGNGTPAPLLGRKSVLMGMAAAMGFVVAKATQPSAAPTDNTSHVPRWTPATAYVRGQQVVSPNNDVVSAKIAHTSAAAYAKDTVKWTLSSRYGRLESVENVARYGAKGDGLANDTAAIQAACNAIGAHGGTVYFPPGNYLARLVRPRSNTLLTGDGATLTYYASGSAPFDAILAFGDLRTAGGRDVASNLRNIRITGLTLRGNGETLGLSENQALIHFSGVSDAVVDNCTFLGMQGDGVYIGATSTAAQERHNERITVTGNTFDGLGNHGRQGVSIIEGRDILIEGNHFRRVASAKMPGAVDIEPNPHDATAVIRNITVRGNTFRGIGGNVADVAIVLTPATFTKGSPDDLVFEGNHHTEGGRAYYVAWPGHESAPSTAHMAVAIRGNYAITSRLGRETNAIQCSTVRGVRVSGNTLAGFGGGAALVSDAIDFAFEDNTVTDCGESSGSILELRGQVTNLSISRNRITKTAGRTLDTLLMAGAGSSSGIQVHSNFTTGVGTLMDTHKGHITMANSNSAVGNIGPSIPTTLFESAASIATPPAPSVTYVQAEVMDLKIAVDAIRAALKSSGITA